MTDRDDLTEVTALMAKVVNTFAIQTVRAGVYPYELTNGVAPTTRTRDFSMSTNAMVAYSLAALGGYLPKSQLANCEGTHHNEFVTDQLPACLKKTVKTLISKIVRAENRGATWLDSGTFGEHDPFSLAWLMELLTAAKEKEWPLEKAEEALAFLEKVAKDTVVMALKEPTVPVLEPTEKKERAVPHPLPLLRIVQLARLLRIADKEVVLGLELAADWFVELLHRQLSLRDIEHGGFDVAELVFCLEGMLLTTPMRVTRPLVNSVLAAVEDLRQIDPTFRAVTPFKTTTSGAVHLFSNVEVVSSLLRCVTLLEGKGRSDLFERVKPALHDYLQWLQATIRTIKISTEEGELRLTGWHSEYEHNEDHTVNMLLTSQVLLYLCSYENLLARDVAARVLLQGGLVADDPQDRREQSPEKRQARVREEDPLQLDESSPYCVASAINQCFVEPRLDGNHAEMAYSCLLYGPPGTGKTRLAPTPFSLGFRGAVKGCSRAC